MSREDSGVKSGGWARGTRRTAPRTASDEPKGTAGRLTTMSPPTS
eukprot:CAMPEP_0196789426 /NCGR_PEP_ID=MMETSP1104-20130614/26575_1 /TAXON_ID=33652 /ORGANISM="Cafeteria sp., Strain Caron Lab Isolate" /LENGTH=44 /DNA_ID= /DNA_START= /DNA_END= /DNA_ORIENTATION=